VTLRKPEKVVVEIGRNEEGGRTFYLARDLIFEWSNGVILRITIPKGFATDFASVPRPLRWLFPLEGPWLEPAIVHDFCYGRNVPFSRFFSDALFRELMREYGVPPVRRFLIYWGVRLFRGSTRRPTISSR